MYPEVGLSPLRWTDQIDGVMKWSNYTTHTSYFLGSIIELVKPSNERKGVMYWDPRTLPTRRYGSISNGQISWLKKNYFFILTEFWHNLINEVKTVIPDLSLFEFLMTKDLQDEIEYSKAGLLECVPYSYSDLTHDLDDSYYEVEKEFDFVSINYPRPFKQLLEALNEIPAGSSVLLLHWIDAKVADRESAPYIRACMEVCQARKHKVEFSRFPRSVDIYRHYARGKVALQLSNGEGNYRSLTEVLKCGVPALYVPYIRGGGSRYVHPLRGKGGVGEPVYHMGEIRDKAVYMLDHYGDYKPRRILELTSREMVLALMRQRLFAAYEKVGQQWDGCFEEITGWDPGRCGSILDVRSIPEAKV